MRKILTVSKQELQKREAEDQQRREVKRSKKLPFKSPGEEG
jgi:hypothetical protein